MNPLPVLFAQSTLDPSQALAPWFNMDSRTREILLILGALVIVTLGILVWAVYFRKRGRRHSHHRHHQGEQRNEARSGEDLSKRRKWRRRRRRDSRPRNPTLAETGGLPPLRTQPPPSDSEL